MFKKKKTYVILTLIVLVTGGIYYWKSQPKKIEYTTETAKVGTIAKTVSITGILRTKDEIALSFKVGGEVLSVNFDVGSKIKKGDILGKIDSESLKYDLKKAQADLNAQREEYAMLKRKRKNYTHEQIKTQRITVEKYRLIVESIQDDLSKIDLVSPLDGTVIQKDIDPGENVLAGKSVAIVSSDGEMFVEVSIPESDIVDVKIGQMAVLSFDSLSSSEKLNGEVFEIEPASTVIQDVVYYKAKIKFAKFDERLKLGMSADADINTFQKDNVVMVPFRAVKTESNQEYVEILRAENFLEKINVKTGFKGDDGMVEIVSGIKGGENIIILSSEK